MSRIARCALALAMMLLPVGSVSAKGAHTVRLTITGQLRYVPDPQTGGGFVYLPAELVGTENTGRGPALNTMVAQKIVKGPERGKWVDPVRVPTLAAGQEVLLTWLDHENDTGLGATYEDEDGRVFTSLTGNDLTRVIRGREIPLFSEDTIRRHWQVGIGRSRRIGE